jgi:CRP-like cAMP-binding protein
MIYLQPNGHNSQDNRILSALPAEETERLLPHMEQVELRLGDVISQPDEPLKYVYFPHRGAISVIAVLEDGSQVEVGVVGNEGMYGLPVVLGTDTSPLLAIVQLAGGATRMRADVLREEVSLCGRLQNLLLRYGQAFFIMTAQNVACNRRHCVDGRLARWLLMSQDRAKSDEMQLTHEFLSIMLGVRRAGISEAASKLQTNGLISYRRGRVHIVDRQGLEATSCECYHVVKKEFDRLLAV